jgi:hypothetical protein
MVPGIILGYGLEGAVVTTPVTNWSFVSQYKTDKVQTRTWYHYIVRFAAADSAES